MISPQYVDGLELRTEELASELRSHKAALAGLQQERDTMAAQVERLTKAALDAIHYLPGGKIKAELRDAYDEAPEASLARLKAEWQADALTEMIAAIPFREELARDMLRYRRDELRQQAEEVK